MQRNNDHFYFLIHTKYPHAHALPKLMFGPYLPTRLFSARAVIKGRSRNPLLFGKDERRRKEDKEGGVRGDTFYSVPLPPLPASPILLTLSYEEPRHGGC